MTESAARDDQILARAMEIRTETGLSLTDAMIQAESELDAPASEPVQETFVVTLKPKPRVARWIRLVFGGHPQFSIEDRLEAYLLTLLNKSRVSSMRASEDPPEVGKGQAVTVRREHMPRVIE
jgi:hypothetical protein